MSEGNINKNEEIEFVYEYDPNYKIVASNGVWGGITSRGDFRLDFFVESQTVPEKITNLVEDGKLGRELSRVPAKRMYTRRMQVGVLLTQKELTTLVEFFNEQLKIFIKATEGT